MAEIKQSDTPNQAKRKKSLGIFIVIFTYFKYHLYFVLVFLLEGF